MGSEDRVDHGLAQHVEHCAQRYALGMQRRHCGVEAARLRASRVVEVFAPAPDAVDLFGQVDDLEPGRERPHQVLGLRGAATGYAGAQRPDVAIAILVSVERDRPAAVRLDHLEQVFAALVTHDLADEPAECIHVVP